ncbi:hypothetical protein C1645_765735, partial [Glomus cerebriforme]
MSRTNIFLINFLILIFFASVVASVIIVNTPDNPVYVGSVLQITWSDTIPLNGTGDLRLMLNQSINIEIENNVDLAKLSYTWIVNAPPGTYFWGLFTGIDGIGFSRSFSIMNAPQPSATSAQPSTTVTPTLVNTAPVIQTIISDSNKSSSLGIGIIIGIGLVIGIIALVGISICGYLYFRRKKYIPTAGESTF